MTRDTALESINRNIVKSIPHDLLTPINAITGFSQIMLDDSAIAESESLKEMVSRINVNGNQLFDLIKKYLLFVEFELNQVDYDIRLTLISDDVIAAVADNAAKNHSNRRDEIVIASNSAIVDADYRLIEFALFELIDNALKFSEPGETVTVDIVKMEDIVEIQVLDKGCGFPVIAEEAFSVEKIIQNCGCKSQNHGLSLILVKKILELHKGELKIEPNTPNGSILKMILPLKKM